MKTTFSLLLAMFCFTLVSSAQIPSVKKKATIKLVVFPNPATNVVNVLGLKNSNKAQIAISDSYGNTHIQHQWAIKNNAVNIPVTSLKRGMYLIVIRSKEQQIQTKFYKQ